MRHGRAQAGCQQPGDAVEFGFGLGVRQAGGREDSCGLGAAIMGVVSSTVGVSPAAGKLKGACLDTWIGLL